MVDVKLLIYRLEQMAQTPLNYDAELIRETISALSHAAGQELDSRDETLRVFRDMAGEVHGMFFWRVSPDSKGNHSISHEAVQAVVELCEEIEQGTPAYENLHPALASNTAPPTTSAEVGQDGEQCRAASGVEEIARQMDAMAGHIQASSPEQKSERLRGWASMLRALSRGVPEGNAVIPWRDEIDRMYVEGWAQSLRRIKDYRAYFIEHGYHPEYVAVRLERLLAAIAAQRKEGE